MTMKIIRSAAVLAVPAFLPAPLNAAEPSPVPLSESRWEEMVVVAGHLARPAREVGSAVTVLDAEDIAARQGNLGADLLREVPGVAVNRGGPVGAVTQVRIRGAEGNHTLVLIDGIEANDPALSSEFNFAELLTWDVGRIEVLRGPQSALYGSDSIGGVISISSIDPREGLHGHSEVEAGSFGTSQLGASVSGASGQVSGLLSATRFDTDGISASPIQPEKDGYRNTIVHGKLRVDINPALSARVVARQSDSEVENDRQDFDFPDTPTQGLVVDADDRTEARQRYGLLELNARLLDGRWLHRAALGYTDTESDNMSADMPVSGTRGERRKLEYVSTWLFGDDRFGHALTGGIQHEELEFENLSTSLPGANQTREDDQTSYVAEYAFTYRDSGSVSVSARRDDNDRFDDATTFRTTGSYLFEDSRTRLHASYGEGITNPNFFELFGFLPDSFVANPGLEPERSESWDLGVEQSLLDGRVVVDLTYFDATLTDEIVTVFLPSFESTPVNQDGDSERRGAEVTARARLSPAWSLQGSYTYLDATEPDGREEVRRPRHSASVNVNYAFHDGRGNVNLGAVYNGEQEDSEFVNATPRTRATLDDYTLVSLAVSYRVLEGLELFVRGENLMDEEYSEVFGFRSPGASGYAGVRFRL